MENTTLRFRFIYIIGEADVNTSIDISLSLSLSALENYVRDEMRGRMKHGWDETRSRIIRFERIIKLRRCVVSKHRYKTPRKLYTGIVIVAVHVNRV